MRNFKLKTDVKFSIPKSENIPDLKLDFKIPTQESFQLNLNSFQNSLNSSNVIKKPIIKKPLFSNSINTNEISGVFKPPTIDLLKNTKNLNIKSSYQNVEQEEIKNLNSQEDYDTSLPRTEIISLTDFYPLYDNNLVLTKAGNHFKYQLLYLNANRFIINNDVKKYFSQSIKDESLRDELQSLLGLINDKNYQKNDFDLYTNNYFDKLIEISDYSVSQILNFYSKLDNVTNVFIEKNKPISLLQSLNFSLSQSSSIQKLYGVIFLLLEQKISLYSRKISNNQNTSNSDEIAISFVNEQGYKNFNYPTDYKNLKINEGKFNLKIIFEQSEEKRISNIINFITYESYKNANKEIISLELNKLNDSFLNLSLKNLSFKNEDFTKGKLLSLLTKYPQLPNDTKERNLYANLASETYASNVFQNMVSSNFSEDSTSLIGNEINIDNSIKNENSKINNIISGKSNITKRNNNKIIRSLENANNNEPPYLNLFLRNISRNLKNYNFEKFSKNLETTIDNIKDLIAFYYKQVEFCKTAPETTWPEVNGHPAGTYKHAIGGPDNNDEKIKHISDALRFINVEWDFIKWKPESKVSKHYVPYGDSQEDIANFIGFLTYLYKRTSEKPGQYSRDIPTNNFSEIKSNDDNYIKFVGSNSENINQSYWLTFNELIRTINKPDDEYSSLKNPFYKKFAECYINILKGLGITNLNYSSYSYEETINIDNEQIFIMFNVFIFLTDIIKQLFNFDAKVHYYIKWNDEDDGWSRNHIFTERNMIGIAGVGEGPYRTIAFSSETDIFPEFFDDWYGWLGSKEKFIADSRQGRTDIPLKKYKGYMLPSDPVEQHFNALDITFDIEDQVKDFNTTSADWLKEFNQVKETYNFINQQINNVISSINEILSIDYDVLRYFIDTKFVFNKRNFFMTRFQLNDLKNKYSKIKNKDINYLIDDSYDDTYESNITKVLLNFKDSSKNAKILTFGVPTHNIGVSDQIDVIIYRKNLVHQNLNFKPITKTFNLNLFCTLTNFFEKNNLNSLTDYLINSDFYYHKNDLNFNKLTNEQLLKLNRDLVSNHFYSEILNQYTKIMTGIEINDFTLIKDYPVVDSEEVLTNISNIIFNDNQKQESTERLLSIKNNITKFISPLEFRSFLFSSCLFERVFSTLIDPDDFEIDTENWVKRGLIPSTFTDAEQIIMSLSQFIIDGINVIFRNGKFYLNDVNNIENVADSYKVKIDKR